MEKEILNYLENTFHIKFDVKKILGSYEEYKISLNETLKDTFKILVKIKEDIRLTIICEPDVFGMRFVENINSSLMEKRKIFVDYWKVLGEKSVELKINDRNFSMDDFLIDNSKWNKFFLKFTKVSYYNEEIESKKDTILNYISLVIAMILSIMTYEIIGIEGKAEGKQYEDKTIKYERNPINRKLCLSVKGYKCSVCGFDFKKVYGEIGEDFIEVHHTTLVSQMGDNYIVDPIKELFPLCSNCHAMIHRRNPAYTIEELKSIIKGRSE